jgi:hypothetical protein
MLFFATILGWMTFNFLFMAGHREGWVWQLVGEYQRLQEAAIMCGVGAGLFGVLSIVVLCTGKKHHPSEPRIHQNHSGSNAQGQRFQNLGPIVSGEQTAEHRLAALKALLAKGLISEQEYRASRQRILDEL